MNINKKTEFNLNGEMVTVSAGTELKNIKNKTEKRILSLFDHNRDGILDKSELSYLDKEYKGIFTTKQDNKITYQEKNYLSEWEFDNEDRRIHRRVDSNGDGEIDRIEEDKYEGNLQFRHISYFEDEVLTVSCELVIDENWNYIEQTCGGYDSDGSYVEMSHTKDSEVETTVTQADGVVIKYSSDDLKEMLNDEQNQESD